VVLATERACETHGLTPKAWIRSWAFTSHAPKKGVLLGPTYATPLALERAGLTMADIGLFDMHEAFAGQVAANLAAMDSDEWAQQEMGRESAMGRPSDDILNVNGGSVAIGHPFGATGTRIIIQLMNEMQRRDVRYGALAICAGGTRGASMVLERV
jgi:acetyl-CoA acyltransferase